MSYEKDLIDRLISEAIDTGNVINRNDIADRAWQLMSAESPQYIELFGRKGLAEAVSKRLAKFSIVKISERFSLPPDLFPESIQALYPIDGEVGRQWMPLNKLSELQLNQAISKLKSQNDGLTKHIRSLEALLRAAVPYWRSQPNWDLGTCLQSASQHSQSAAE